MKEEKKLQEGSEVASQTSASRTEANEVSTFKIVLQFCLWQSLDEW